MLKVSIQDVISDQVRFPITNSESPLDVRIVGNNTVEQSTRIQVELMLATPQGVERMAVVHLLTVPRKDESVLCQEIGKDQMTLFRVMEVVHCEEGIKLFGTASQFAVAAIR